AEHEGVAISVFTSADRDVRAHWANVGGLAVCSNSPVAIRRVIDAAKRAIPSVADTPEFKLMRSLFPPNSPVEDVFAFCSESFLRAQFGPRQRILLHRRAAESEQAQARQASAFFRAWDTGKPIAEAPLAFSPPLIERDIDKISKAEDAFYQEYREHYRT